MKLDMDAVDNDFSKTTKLLRWIGGGFCFISYALISAFLTGAAWVWPQYALLGIPGLAFFLHGQLLQPKLRWRILHGLFTGYVTFSVATYWMISTVEITVPVTSLQAWLSAHAIHLVHGSMFACFAILGWLSEKKLPHGWFLWPFLFAFIETFWPSLFPFRQGCLLHSVPPLVQVVSVFGISAATVQIIALSGLFPLVLDGFFASKKTERLNPRACRTAVLFVLVMTLGSFGWGAYRCHQISNAEKNYSGRQLSVLAIQNDTCYATYHVDLMSHSREANEDCDLIVWPECTLGHFDKGLTSFADIDQLYDLGYEVGLRSFRPLPEPKCHLLAAGYSSIRKPNTGITLADFSDDPPEHELESKYVTAYLIDPTEKVIGVHDKVELMAGGEYMPAKWFFGQGARCLSLLASIGQSQKLESADEAPVEIFDFEEDPSHSIHPLSPGDDPKPIGVVQGVSIGTVLCCEDMYSSISRTLTLDGADLLVCLANGTCFNSESALNQHYMIAMFRAIENNRYFLRCGSKGVTALVNPAGTELEKLECLENDQMAIQIPGDKRAMSFFTRFGSWPLYCGFFAAYLVFWKTCSRRDESSS